LKRIKTASPKAIQSFLTHKLFRRAVHFKSCDNHETALQRKLMDSGSRVKPGMTRFLSLFQFGNTPLRCRAFIWHCGCVKDVVFAGVFDYCFGFIPAFALCVFDRIIIMIVSAIAIAKVRNIRAAILLVSFFVY